MDQHFKLTHGHKRIFKYNTWKIPHQPSNPQYHVCWALAYWQVLSITNDNSTQKGSLKMQVLSNVIIFLDCSFPKNKRVFRNMDKVSNVKERQRQENGCRWRKVNLWMVSESKVSSKESRIWEDNNKGLRTWVLESLMVCMLKTLERANKNFMEKEVVAFRYQRMGKDIGEYRTIGEK